MNNAFWTLATPSQNHKVDHAHEQKTSHDQLHTHTHTHIYSLHFFLCTYKWVHTCGTVNLYVCFSSFLAFNYFILFSITIRSFSIPFRHCMCELYVFIETFKTQAYCNVEPYIPIVKCQIFLVSNNRIISCRGWNINNSLA